MAVPDSVRREAGLRRGERVEFRVSGRTITITPKEDDEYTPAECRSIDRAIAQSEKEYAAGLGRGPFATAGEFAASMEAGIRKPRRRATPPSYGTGILP